MYDISTSITLAWMFTGLGIGCFVLYGIFRLIKKRWPGRDDWYASSSYSGPNHENDPQRAIDKSIRKQWRSSNPQELDAWFKVDMATPRIITNIKFEISDHWVETEQPAKWQMRFYGKETDDILGDKIGKGSIHARGEEIPSNIQAFAVYIREIAEDAQPGNNYYRRYGSKKYWAISNIRIRGYRFSISGKKFCKYEL